jgi:hypothetical protein
MGLCPDGAQEVHGDGDPLEAFDVLTQDCRLGGVADEFEVPS